MSLKKRIRRLQRQFQKGHVLTMPDGRMIPFGEEEGLDVLIAAINGQQHWLLPYYLEIHEAAQANGGCLEGVPHKDVELAQQLWAINCGVESAKAKGLWLDGDDELR